MHYLPLILTAVSIHLLAVISPGPDFIMVLKNSLTHSRKTGILTAVGLGGGIMVHLTYCVLGLALVISKSIVLFSLLKYLGAAYLMYIGIKSFMARGIVPEIDEKKVQNDISTFQALRSGFLTNVLNPKATLFFLGLFTLVLTPTTPPSVMLLISALLVLDTVLWFSLVAVFFTQKRVRAIFDKIQSKVNKIFGVFLVLFGIKVALTK